MFLLAHLHIFTINIRDFSQSPRCIASIWGAVFCSFFMKRCNTPVSYLPSTCSWRITSFASEISRRIEVIDISQLWHTPGGYLYHSGCMGRGILYQLDLFNLRDSSLRSSASSGYGTGTSDVLSQVAQMQMQHDTTYSLLRHTRTQWIQNMFMCRELEREQIYCTFFSEVGWHEIASWPQRSMISIKSPYAENLLRLSLTTFVCLW